MIFLREVRENPELREAFLFMQALQQSLASEGSVAQPASRRLPLRWPALGIAAVVILLVLPLAWWLWPSATPATPASLFAAYYHPYPAGVLTRTEASNPQEDPATLAYQAYARSDWTTASEQFRQLSRQQPDHEAYRFFLAQCLLTQDEGAQAEARAIWTALIASEGPFAALSRWYLSLAWLKAGQPDQAKLYLEPLAQSDHPKQEEASKLLQALSHLKK